VTCRGNERRDVFRDDGDRERFLAVLGRTVSLFRWRLHAYVLMGNHYHLVVETPEPTLSRGMRQLNGIYTQAFNRSHRRVGHLFQGRFRAILVEKEAHLLELCRYVVLNPVRAGVVRTARGWPWSSYRATAGLTEAPEWLETGWTLEQFGRTRAKSTEAYRRFVAEGRGSRYEPWGQVIRQVYLGSEGFRREISARLKGKTLGRGVPKGQTQPFPPKIERAEEAVRRVFGVSMEELTQRSRSLAGERRLLASVLRRDGLYGLQAIGKALGVGPEQAGLLARAGDEMAADPRRERLLAALSGK
jgi:REP element-mobilizing transposase RayT